MLYYKWERVIIKLNTQYEVSQQCKKMLLKPKITQKSTNFKDAFSGQGDLQWLPSFFFFIVRCESQFSLLKVHALPLF